MVEQLINNFTDIISKSSKEIIDTLTELEHQQVEMDTASLQHDIILWNSFRELHQKYQSFKPTREKIPHYWNYVLKNSGILNKIGTTPSDNQILEFLKDIYLTSFVQVCTPDPTVADRRRLRVGFKIVFEFEKNQWFEEIELSKTLSYLYNDTIPYGKMVNSGVTFYEGKNPKIIDGSENSFFDFFEPVNQKEEYSDVEEEEEIEEKVDEQLEDALSFSNDIILNSLYYFKNQLDRYEGDEISSDLSSLVSDENEGEDENLTDNSYDSE